MSRPRILSRPTGMLTRAQVAASGWRLQFGDIDAVPLCACCGAGLTRHAAVLGDGRVLGVDCAVALGLLTSRDRPARWSPVALTAAEQRLIDAYPDAFAAVARLPAPRVLVRGCALTAAIIDAAVAHGAPAQVAAKLTRVAQRLA